MKFNWGTGIFIFFVLFVGTLIFVLYQSRQIDHSLVVDNYYEEDINYQTHYDKKQNTANLPQQVSSEYDEINKRIILSFPVLEGAKISGNVTLYDPISNSADHHYPIKITEEGKFEFPTTGLRKGRWIIKMDWKRGNVPYYQEQEFIL